jgi:hypothetical protein
MLVEVPLGSSKARRHLQAIVGKSADRSTGGCGCIVGCSDWLPTGRYSIMRNKNRPVSAFLTNVTSFEITEFIP